MRFLKKLLKAAAISFALFAAGIVWAAVIFPDTDLPDWYSLAVVFVPFAVFIFLLARNKPHTVKTDAPAPQTGPSPSCDTEAQRSEPVSPPHPASSAAAEASRQSEQRNMFSAADFDDPVYVDNAFPGKASRADNGQPDLRKVCDSSK